MTRRPENASGPETIGKAGSILAETLLVLPLFLVLLGGLFVVGDLLSGRILQHDMDRVAAWVGASLVFRGNLESVFSPELDAWTPVEDAPGPKLEKGLLPKGYFAQQPVDARPDAAGDGSGQLRGNEWIDFYEGRADVSVGVPYWASLLDIGPGGMMSKTRTDKRFKLFRETTGFPDPSGRVGVFRRRRSSILSDSPLFRGKPAAELAYSQILGEGWPGAPAAASVEGIEPAEGYVRSEIAVLFGE